MNKLLNHRKHECTFRQLFCEVINKLFVMVTFVTV